jgi:hypothetical protein
MGDPEGSTTGGHHGCGGLRREHGEENWYNELEFHEQTPF